MKDRILSRMMKLFIVSYRRHLGTALLSVARVRRHPQLEVISKYAENHPGHAGIQMLLSDGVVYKFKRNSPTPMQILALQTYLVSIVEQVLMKSFCSESA